MLKISENEIQKLCQYAVDEYPNECCGILLGSKRTGSVQEIYRAKNVAAIDRKNLHFLMNPLELYRVELEAEKNHMEIVGFYHSHTDYPAVLSAEDISFMIQGCVYLVVPVMKGICGEIKCFMKENGDGEVYEITTDCG
ncbi:MAG: M67 family metallopeptidase [Eubacteriales bacterium]|nr:M67 family metallopeptidase [Eubacteriales bacterium]